MKLSDEERKLFGAEILSKFEQSDERNRFFYESYLNLLECPDIVQTIEAQLLLELDLLKQSGILSTNLYNPDTGEYEFKHYTSQQEQNLAVDEYKAVVIATCELIVKEAAALRFIENNRNKPVHHPSIEWDKFAQLRKDIAKYPDVKKLYGAFEKKNCYSHFFGHSSTLKKSPLLAKYIHDCLTSNIDVVMRSYTQNLSTFDPETKKIVRYAFGSYSSRNEFLTKLKEYLDEYLSNLLERSKKQSQPGDEEN